MTSDSRLPASSSKKTEMIEVRVSHETKRDFLAACRRQGRTASEVIREAVAAYIDGDAAPRLPETPTARPEAKQPILALIPRPLRRKRYLAIASAAAGLTVLAALPSTAQPNGQSAACNRFQQLDANHDGKLSFDEYGRP